MSDELLFYGNVVCLLPDSRMAYIDMDRIAPVLPQVPLRGVTLLLATMPVPVYVP